jgi:nicotinamidase-related amidase
MKALIINDMENDFVDEKGALRVDTAATCVKPIIQLKTNMKKEGSPVIYVCDTHFKGDKEFEKWGTHTVEGTWGADIIKELQPDKNDYIIKKWRYSAFYATPLDMLLRQLTVDTIVLTGVLTDVCIQHTAADAYFRGYKTIVPKQCTATITEERKQYALNFIAQMYDAEIVD